jgi:UDP-N-acetylmuramoyl-tripeptide--D-alanyl-D-alanine ligase
LKLEKAIEHMNGAATQLDPALRGIEIGSVVIDSREVRAGDVFFALSQPDYANNGFNGEFEDATKYVASALDEGAGAAVVRQDRFEEHRSELEPFLARLIFVADTIKALQDLAHNVFLSWDKAVVGITGSAGKTTAKELTAQVLEGSGRKVLRNQKNYNNGLGLPLTVLNLVNNDTFDAAVLEMGMSTPMNEIQRLCRITPPDVSVVLNVLPVHVEHLGSIENVAAAKAEIIEGMKNGGTAVLNADDPRVLAMASLSKGEVLTFAIDNDADIKAEHIRFPRFGSTVFELKTPAGRAVVEYPLNGRHNIMNALAAAAVGHRFDMTPEAIAEALGKAVPPPQRGEILHFAEGFTVINDSYNSNPAALLSMVRTMVDGGVAADRKIVVAGEMLELGENATQLHRYAGREVAESGVDKLIGVRGLAAELTSAAKENGLADAVFAEDSDSAAEILVRDIRKGDLILVKGSRGVRTERVIEKLSEHFELETA